MLWVTCELLAATAAMGAVTAAELHLKSGDILRVTTVVFDGQLLVAESPFGRLSIPREQVGYIAWGAVSGEGADLTGSIVFADGSRLRGPAERIGPDGVVARTPWGGRWL